MTFVFLSALTGCVWSSPCAQRSLALIREDVRAAGLTGLPLVVRTTFFFADLAVDDVPKIRLITAGEGPGGVPVRLASVELCRSVVTAQLEEVELPAHVFEVYGAQRATHALEVPFAIISATFADLAVQSREAQPMIARNLE